MRAEILSIGTELLLGDIVNTNAQYLSKRLAEVGVYVYFQTVVGDNPDRIMEAYRLAYERAELVIISGGLGPTEDDLTKEMAARFFNKKMIFYPEIWASIKRYYENRGSKPVESARKQAEFPETAEILDNPAGTAPGCWLNDMGRMMAMLPGPPREMIPMFENQVLPRIKPFLKQTFQSQVLRICGTGESNVEEALKDLIHQQQNPTIATYAKEGEVHVRITARAEKQDTAMEMLEPVVDACKKELGTLVYGMGEQNLEETIFAQLQSKSSTLAIAESLTGGMLTARLVNVPGMSKCLTEGLIPYSNESKIRLLGIPEKVLMRHGPVSEEIAGLMAQNVAEQSKATIGLAVTGWAGPDSLPEQLPGLIWMGLYMNRTVKTRKVTFGGDRNRLRFIASNMALCWLLQELRNEAQAGNEL